MIKSSKLYARLLASRNAMKFRDFQRVLEAFGFTLDRVNGSHHQYVHPLATRPLSIQPKGNMAKPYQIDQFLDMVEEHSLTLED
ncbi:MAG TPA: type II toxin-antitoxin system HicA family toxin [Novosphingobium sp.]|nr:type II toxin-antitoxin system HicA family toxin [Novosphingobium sp.]HQA17977.1 type II toxin-antitoxin system HicA family toxin [Novosphingobium sp.]